MSKIYRVDINNKELAYSLGFLLGDSHLQKTGRIVLTIQLRDKKVVEFIQKHIKGNSRISLKRDIKKKIFPNITLSILGKDFPNAKSLFKGELKIDRSIPIIKTNLEKYLVLGFFDAEGTITWGYRKDRNRVWQKAAFHSQLKMLEGIQKILAKNNISTIIKPVKNSKHYIIEITNATEIIKLYKYLYDDLIVLNRKKDNFDLLIKALLKQNEIKENDFVKIISDTTFKKYNFDKLYYLKFPYRLYSQNISYKVKNIKGDNIFLNDIETPINIHLLSKTDHTKYVPLRIELEELLEKFKTQPAAELSEIEGSETTGSLAIKNNTSKSIQTET